MSRCIADASTLVSLGIVAEDDPDPLALCLSQYDVVVPTAVIGELREIASYEDTHGHAASTILNRMDSFTTQSVEYPQRNFNPRRWMRSRKAYRYESDMNEYERE